MTEQQEKQRELNRLQMAAIKWEALGFKGMAGFYRSLAGTYARENSL